MAFCTIVSSASQMEPTTASVAGSMTSMVAAGRCHAPPMKSP